MDYKKYSIEDFVLDKEFRKWVHTEDEAVNTFWNDWVKKNPGKLSEIQEARRILKNLNFPAYKLTPSEKEDLFEGISGRISGADSSEVKMRYLDVDGYQGKSPRWALRFGVAASLIIGVAWLVMLLVQDSRFGQLAYHTDFGETKEVKLSDGTMVTLNANSKIYIGELGAQGQAREVWLEGEAFFDVTHTQTDQAFIVHANKLDVNVLGTEFNVYARGKKAEVALASGKVRLANTASKQELEMKPGDRVVYESVYQKPVKDSFDPAEVSSWKKNLLIFRRTSLEDISDLLKTNYDIDVFFTGGASSDHYFTGTTPADDIDLLLKTISKSFDLHVERKEKTVIISPNNKK